MSQRRRVALPQSAVNKTPKYASHNEFGRLSMWNVTPDHLRQAHLWLSQQLAEIRARQADELAAIEAQHARERKGLDDELASLDRLDTLIETFIADFHAPIARCGIACAGGRVDGNRQRGR